MSDYGYGVWTLSVVDSAFFIVYATGFCHPRSSRDWRVMGGFSAFVVALFTELYGYPLSIYLLTGPVSGLVPGVDLSHDSGHLGELRLRHRRLLADRIRLARPRRCAEERRVGNCRAVTLASATPSTSACC